jgi:hypothetical protein
LELLVDVWLVVVYFFLVEGAERIIEIRGRKTILPSAYAETSWIMVIFGTYLVWDVLTKRREPRMLVQRGWATLTCTALSVLTFCVLRHTNTSVGVLSTDASLLAIVLLFRAMKKHNLEEHTRSSWALVGALTAAWVGSCWYVLR